MRSIDHNDSSIDHTKSYSQTIFQSDSIPSHKAPAKKIQLVLLMIIFCLNACVSREDGFTSGRLERLCEASLPICNTRVTCSLDEESYLTGVFPGAERTMIYTPHPLTTITVNFLIDDQVFPGTEMLVRAHQIGCVEVYEERLVDVDIFRRAGDDRILSFSFDLEGRGDHLIEWFADATATYAVTIDFNQRSEE